MGLHCPLRALGVACPAVHDRVCRTCDAMHAVLPALASFLTRTQGPSIPDIEKMFLRYQAHKLRECWQRAHLDDIEAGLQDKPNHLLLVVDHKQRIPPVYNRESQESYFGKKGRAGWGMGDARVDA